MAKSTVERYHAAAIQTAFENPRTRAEIPSRVARMIAMAEQTVAGYGPFFDVRLVVFPEFAHAAPCYFTTAELDEHLAVEIPNDHTDAYQRFSRKTGCFVQTGSFIERDPKYPGALFNTTCLIGPDGILSKYRKVNPWIPWEVHTSPHRCRHRDRQARLRDLLRLAFSRVDSPVGLQRSRGADSHQRVHGSVGRDCSDGLVDHDQPRAGD